jgi:hypothetical protein
MKLRIATYNVEWMNNLFVPGKAKMRTSKGQGMGRQVDAPSTVAQKIASLIDLIDPEILGIQEGPAKIEQMIFFVEQFLGGRFEVYGVESGAQSIYALVNKNLDLKVRQMDPDHRLYELLGTPTPFQPWGEYNSTKRHRMDRPPVILMLGKKGLRPIELVVVHTKSQFSPGLTIRKFLDREPTAMKAAILARQKLSAEIAAYRRHVTHMILSRKASGVILIGDLNDGFGKSVFETEFLLQSLIDELRGSFRRQSALLEHAFDEHQLVGRNAYSVDFKDPSAPGKITRELIDHILMTPQIRQNLGWLRFQTGSGRIGHEESAKFTDNRGLKGDERPSDHLPVWADFEYDAQTVS